MILGTHPLTPELEQALTNTGIDPTPYRIRTHGTIQDQSDGTMKITKITTKLEEIPQK